MSLRTGKNLESYKTYKGTQQEGLFYPTAFFIKTNPKFSSSVLVFSLLLYVLLNNYSYACFSRDSSEVGRMGCTCRSVSTRA